MSDIQIRKATPADAQSLAECIDSAYSAFESKIPDLPDVSDGLLTAIDEKSVWLAEKRGTIVGGIVLDPNDDYLILENVAVHPNASGSGIGKLLIQKAESECQRLALREFVSVHTRQCRRMLVYMSILVGVLLESRATKYT